MENLSKCNNCAWYCHSDSQCYANAVQEELAIPVSPDHLCRYWTFDGLTDQERAEYEAENADREGIRCLAAAYGY